MTIFFMNDVLATEERGICVVGWLGEESRTPNRQSISSDRPPFPPTHLETDHSRGGPDSKVTCPLPVEKSLENRLQVTARPKSYDYVTKSRDNVEIKVP